MDALRKRLKSKTSRRLYDISPFYYQCSEHGNRDCVSACVTCVELLCSKCLENHGDEEGGCHMIQFSKGDVYEVCEHLKTSLLNKMSYINESVNNICMDIVNKKKRMLRKKHETALEIELFFNRLRSRLEEKLKTDEKVLIDLLQGKASDEDMTLSTCINQCNDINRSLREKNSIVASSEVRKLDSTNVSRFLQYLLQIGHEVNQIDNHRSDLLFSRDALLVIRLCIDSQTHHAMLHNQVAEVEVIHSHLDDTSGPDVPADPVLVDINTPPPTTTAQTINRATVEGGSHSAFDLPLRVHLDGAAEQDQLNPLDVQLIHFSEDETDTNDANVRTQAPTVAPGTVVGNRTEDGVEARAENTGDLLDLPGLYSTTGITSSEGIREENGNCSDSYDIGSNIGNQRDQTPHSEHTNDATRSNDNQTNSVEERETGVADTVSEPVLMESLDTITESNDVSASQSGENRETAATSNVDAAHTHSPPTYSSTPHPDDPPPPYPGTTHASTSPLPGPNDLPPPYPGLAPPPYSREAQPNQRRQGRRRLHGDSGNHNNRNHPASRSLSPNQDPERNSVSLLSDVIRPVGPLVVFSNSETNDKRAPGITSMAVHDGNSFLFVDRWNKKLKYYSGMGISIGGLIFREEPWDVAKIHDNMYAVTVPKLKTIYKVRADPQGVQTIGTISTFRQYACMAFDSNSINLVCGQVPQFGEPVIEVLSIDTGTVLLSLRKDINGLDFLSYPRYLKITNDGVCVVCDWNKKCLVFFKLDGTVIGQYKGTHGHPLKEPTGMELDRETNTVYVIDAKYTEEYGAIHAVSMDCVCTAIYGGPGDFRDARALSLVKNKLAVGSKSGILSVYQPRRRYRARTEA